MSKIGQIMQHFSTHGSITCWEAIEKYGIRSLSSIVHTLRCRGVQIRSEWTELPDGDNGRCTKQVKYVYKNVDDRQLSLFKEFGY